MKKAFSKENNSHIPKSVNKVASVSKYLSNRVDITAFIAKLMIISDKYPRCEKSVIIDIFMLCMY